MNQDPFGNLRDWTPVLDKLDELAESGRLDLCEPGLIRILRFKGNWRLREAVLTRLAAISRPSGSLIHEVMRILADDNIYYEARILAGKALVAMTRRGQQEEPARTAAVSEKIRHLRSIPQPPFFTQALDRCLQELSRSTGAAATILDERMM